MMDFSKLKATFRDMPTPPRVPKMAKKELPDLIGKVFSKKTKNQPKIPPKRDPNQFSTVGFVMTPDLIWRKKTRRNTKDI